MKNKLICLLLTLSGCAAVNPAAVRELEKTGPLAVDPTALAVKVLWPEESSYALATATLRLAATRADGAIVAGAFDLEQRDGSFHLARADHPEFRAIQQKIGAWEAADPSGTQGELSVSAQPCATGVPISTEGNVDINIRLDEKGGFLPLVQNLPVPRLVAQLPQGTIPVCPS